MRNPFDRRAWGIGATVGALLLLGVAVVYAWSFNPVHIAERSAGALLSAVSDDYGHAASHVLVDTDNTPLLLAVGASSMREAFESELVATLTLRAQQHMPVRFISIATSGQTLVESAQLMESYPLPAHSVVLLQLDYERLHVPEAQATSNQVRIPFLHLASARSHKELLVPEENSFRAISHKAWAANWVRGRLNPALWQCASALKHARRDNTCAQLTTLGAFVTAPPTYYPHLYPDSAFSAHTKDSLDALAWVSSTVQDSGSVQRGVALLKGMTQLVSANGSRLVLVRLPADSRVVRGEGRTEADFAVAIAELERAGAAYWDLRGTVSIPDSGFYDLHHVRPFARPRILEAVIARLQTASLKPNPP